MQTHPNDGSNDNPDEFSEFRKDDHQRAENLREGAARAGATAPNADGTNPATPATPAGTPAYGEFGGVEATPAASPDVYSHQAGNNPEGVAAPNITEPDQRGAAPQNRATATVVATQEEDAETRREAYKADDPRYGSGTRNWSSEEEANRSTGPENIDDNTLS
ncbi:hypothetical protein [Hymenobacter elongatus]|uniref:Uncharacterized protein n=1 Tax=Hymenobacter elongatus TaxID=877208 RepID=A0A4Z0PH56_9BACT|nr:hypothetical protein [Hymenobacter elongatus]TGE14161.1 hypothetical protein E5J99_17150 [Hymenobacter elongatus]